jgi:hypothetical protein
MDAILISSIIVTMAVIISATGLVMGNKYISSNYDQKMQTVVTKLNDVQKSSYNFDQKQGRKLQKQNNTLDDVVGNVDYLNDKTVVLDENLTQLNLNYSSYVERNSKDVSDIQTTIKLMPWDQQILNTQDLQNRVKTNEKSIANISYANAQQDDILKSLNKYKDSSTKDISALQTGFYDITGNYVNNKTLTTALKSYPTISALNSAIATINTSLTNINTSVDAIAKTYTKAELVNKLQNMLTQSQQDLATLKQRVLHVEESYTTKSDLASAQLASGKSADSSLNSAINALQTSVSNVVKQVSTLPSSYVDQVEFRNLKTLVNNLNSTTLSLSVDRWITSVDGTNRLYYGNNARTYFGSKNGYEFRSANDQRIASIENNGTIYTNGPLKIRNTDGGWFDQAAIATNSVTNANIGPSFCGGPNGNNMCSHFPWIDGHTYIRPGKPGGDINIDNASTLNLGGNTINTNGNLNANGGMNIAGKWRMADSGDDWLRLNAVNKNGTNDYTGGFASSRMWVRDNTYLNGDTVVNGTLTLNARLNGPLNVNGNVTGNEVYANSWLRARGDNGLYFENHGGGWHMSDDTWIRSFNNKNVYSSQEIRANRMSTEGPLFVGDNSQGGWTGANFKRKDGQWTHFDWVGDGKNYIRGNTVLNGKLDVMGTLNVNDGNDDNTNRGISLWSPTDKRFGIWMGQHSANGGKSIDGGPVPSGDIAHHSVRFSTGANPDGAHGFVFQNSDGKALMSIKGNDARTNIYGDLNTKGINNLTKNGYAVPNNRMFPGSLTIGGVNDNYGHGNNWTGNTAGLLMECADKTEIAVHDSGSRVASIAAYDGPNNRVEIGRDMAWGALDFVDINANRKLALKQAGGNTINFTPGWQGTPDNTGNVSEISNDTQNFKTLMIVGNRSAGQGRKVSVWDRLEVNGTFVNNSDARVKNNIKAITREEINNVNKLIPASYAMNSDPMNAKQYGFIAQDVEKVYPNLVSESSGGIKNLNYNSFIPLLTANIQDIRKNIPDNNKLCLGNTCITEDELKRLKAILNNNHN